MDTDRADDVGGIPNSGPQREAVQGAVRHHSRRYHNHLDVNINTAEWTPSEEEQLFSLQDELGNKWKLIASSLPGRYTILHSGLITASRITSTPNYARVFAP